MTLPNPLTDPTWRKPSGPDLRPIELLHRVGDAEHAVAFCVKAALGGKPHWEERFSIPAHELRQWFPTILDQLEEESFFSINGFAIPKSAGKARPSAFADGLAQGSRKLLRFLTAAFVDVDCYARGISKGQAIGELWDLHEQGCIPPWSMLVDSGRGVWAFWFLYDPAREDRGPVRAWAESIAAWKDIQRAMHARLAGLGADPNALDRARVTRVAGSWNNAARSRVRYLIAADSAGQPILHTLGGLASALGVKDRKASPRLRALAVDPDRVLRGRRGTVGRWARELTRLRLLEKLRNGWPEGTRNYALWITAGALLRIRNGARNLARDGHELAAELAEVGCMTDHDLLDELAAVADRCRPPLSRSDARSKLDQFKGDKRQGLRNMPAQSIANALDVTPEEVAELAEHGAGGWPCAVRFGEVPQARTPAGRTDARNRRRAALRGLLAAWPELPPLRQIGAALHAAGFAATDRTVMRDLDALGVANPRARRGAPERSTTPGGLFADFA